MTRETINNIFNSPKISSEEVAKKFLDMLNSAEIKEAPMIIQDSASFIINAPKESSETKSSETEKCQASINIKDFDDASIYEFMKNVRNNSYEGVNKYTGEYIMDEDIVQKVEE